jgi:hypothetical protein
MASLIYNFLVLVIQTAPRSQGPPSPGTGGTNGPRLPIDDNIWILVVLGLVFGVYMIYKRSQATNKA